MFSYIKGEVKIKANNFIAIDVNNIGFKIFMTEKEIQQIEIGDIVKVYTYMRVKDDDISLFGFLSNDELTMFELLISVGGIGAKSATQILSAPVLEGTSIGNITITSNSNLIANTNIILSNSVKKKNIPRYLYDFIKNYNNIIYNISI